MGTSQWGLEVPVDKGDHDVTVTAPGKKPWKKTAKVKADVYRAEIEGLCGELRARQCRIGRGHKSKYFWS